MSISEDILHFYKQYTISIIIKFGGSIDSNLLIPVWDTDPKMPPFPNGCWSDLILKYFAREHSFLVSIFVDKDDLEISVACMLPASSKRYDILVHSPKEFKEIVPEWFKTILKNPFIGGFCSKEFYKLDGDRNSKIFFTPPTQGQKIKKNSIMFSVMREKCDEADKIPGLIIMDIKERIKILISKCGPLDLSEFTKEWVKEFKHILPLPPNIELEEFLKYFETLGACHLNKFPIPESSEVICIIRRY